MSELHDYYGYCCGYYPYKLILNDNQKFWGWKYFMTQSINFELKD